MRGKSEGLRKKTLNTEEAILEDLLVLAFLVVASLDKSPITGCRSFLDISATVEDTGLPLMSSPGKQSDKTMLQMLTDAEERILESSSPSMENTAHLMLS